MFKVKQNDIFAKNMSQGELYQVYLKFKAKKQMDKFLNKIIAKNGTTKYQNGKEIRKQSSRSNNVSGNSNGNNNGSMMKYPKIVGWSVVIVLWSVTSCALSQGNNEDIVEASNTAEDMIEWIEHDLEAGNIDSSTAEMYISNLDGVVINLGIVR